MNDIAYLKRHVGLLYGLAIGNSVLTVLILASLILRLR